VFPTLPALALVASASLAPALGTPAAGSPADAPARLRAVSPPVNDVRPQEPPAPDDPLELLWSHRLHFAGDGSPLVTVRIDEGEPAITLVPRGAAVVTADDRPRGFPAGTELRFRVSGGRPAELRWAVRVAERRHRDKAGAREDAARWSARGFPVRLVVEGGLYGLAGRVLDTRRYAVLVGEPGPRARAEADLARIERQYPGEPASLWSELAARPAGTVDLLGPGGAVLASAPGVLTVDVPGGEGILVRDVEHDHGYAAHGREDRLYRGRVFVTVGADGRAAAVNVVPLEELLRGIVPAEIYATAPAAALAAQAVTARGEVLAKIGARHLADPYLLCAEQHCQVYKGRAGENPNTDRAIAATRGETLFGTHGLVDSVYSAMCGGHTEDNDAVWGGLPDPHLRGVPDWEGHPPHLARFEARIDDHEVADFLAADASAACGRSSFTRADRYRWERRFTAAEVDRLAAPLGVGRVRSLAVRSRGASGRANLLAVEGTAGTATVRGELAIRRLFGNLNSALFVLHPEGPPAAPVAWTFRGGGWGHGVGLCQTGAIGRAEAGADYRAILRHYFSGADLVRLY
jgi:stage II sporulation protein D